MTESSTIEAPAGTCPSWCDDHITDTDGVTGWHQSSDRRVGRHFICVSDETPIGGAAGVYVWPDGAGFPDRLLSPAELTAMIEDLEALPRALRQALVELENGADR